MGYILKMSYKSAFKLIRKAQEENAKDGLFELYCTLYPNMDRNNFFTFDEYLEKSRVASVDVDSRDRDTILKEIEETKKQFENEENVDIKPNI
jgi:hypothetical protein